MDLLELARSALPRGPVVSAPAQPDGAARRWQVHFPTADPMEVLFATAATLAEIAAIYPGARIEALPKSSGRSATPTEAAELRELVALLFGEASESDRVAVLQAAFADPAAALTSFRALVSA